MTAPVALFVYNRADNTEKTLEALMANTLASETDLYVFSDGGKDAQSWEQVHQVRQLLHRVQTQVKRTQALKSMTLVFRPQNLYLEQNITSGIAQVFQKHDRIIVLEDDICTSTYFLEYMNEAFDLYKNQPTVMHVAGFTNLDIFPTPPEGSEIPVPFYFTPHMSGWGWGTWRDRWQQHFVHYRTREEALQGLSPADFDAIQYGGVFPCLKSLDKQPIPWDICWELAIYRNHGLSLTPGHTLVRNIGLAQGTHFRSFSLLQNYEYDREPLATALPLWQVEHPAKDPVVERLFADAITDWGIRYTPLGKVVRALYYLFRRK